MRVLPAIVIAAIALAAFPAAAAGTTVGVDVSRFNGKVDWDRVAGAGVRFAYVAASRGGGSDCSVKPARCGADPWFERNRRSARAGGVRVGAYHRAFVNGAASPHRARADALREADLFADGVGSLRRGELLPALDLETPFGALGPGRLRLWARTWLRKVERRLGATPMIYTNAVSWDATGDSAAFARAGHRLWIASWDVRRPALPAHGWAGRGWSVWQHTSSGRVPGVSGRVDLDRLGVRFRAISVR